jgi:hypothetical protein
MVQIAAKGGDLMKALSWSNPPMTSFRLRNMRIDTSHVPLQNMRDLAGELPFSIEQGIEATVNWLRARHWG